MNERQELIDRIEKLFKSREDWNHEDDYYMFEKYAITQMLLKTGHNYKLHKEPWGCFTIHIDGIKGFCYFAGGEEEDYSNVI